MEKLPIGGVSSWKVGWTIDMGKKNQPYEIMIVAGGMDQNEPTKFAHIK